MLKHSNRMIQKATAVPARGSASLSWESKTGQEVASKAILLYTPVQSLLDYSANALGIVAGESLRARTQAGGYTRRVAQLQPVFSLSCVQAASVAWSDLVILTPGAGRLSLNVPPQHSSSSLQLLLHNAPLGLTSSGRSNYLCNCHMGSWSECLGFRASWASSRLLVFQGGWCWRKEEGVLDPYLLQGFI